MTTKTDDAPSTPSATWRANGEPDPHHKQYDCERAALTLGSLTDDELANGVFMNADQPMDIARVLARDPNYHSPIVWLTAAKERIRWLSRALERALVTTPKVQADGYPDRLLSESDASLAWRVDAWHKRNPLAACGDDGVVSIVIEPQAPDLGALGEFWHIERESDEPDEAYLSRINARKTEFKDWLSVKLADSAAASSASDQEVES